MIRALTLAALLAHSITLCSALEIDAGYPNPSGETAQQLEAAEDFTDNGVGCADDCLQVAPYVETDTPDEQEDNGTD